MRNGRQRVAVTQGPCVSVTAEMNSRSMIDSTDFELYCIHVHFDSLEFYRTTNAFRPNRENSKSRRFSGKTFLGLVALQGHREVFQQKEWEERMAVKAIPA